MYNIYTDTSYVNVLILKNNFLYYILFACISKFLVFNDFKYKIMSFDGSNNFFDRNIEYFSIPYYLVIMNVTLNITLTLTIINIKI